MVTFNHNFTTELIRPYYRLNKQQDYFTSLTYLKGDLEVTIYFQNDFVLVSVNQFARNVQMKRQYYFVLGLETLPETGIWIRHDGF